MPSLQTRAEWERLADDSGGVKSGSLAAIRKRRGWARDDNGEAGRNDERVAPISPLGGPPPAGRGQVAGSGMTMVGRVAAMLLLAGLPSADAGRLLGSG